jgi:hypothetical protein
MINIINHVIEKIAEEKKHNLRNALIATGAGAAGLGAGLLLHKNLYRKAPTIGKINTPKVSINTTHTPAAKPAPSAKPAPAAKPAEYHAPAAKPVEKPAPAAKPVENHTPAAKPVEKPAPAAKPVENHATAAKPVENHTPVYKPLNPSALPGYKEGLDIVARGDHKFNTKIHAVDKGNNPIYHKDKFGNPYIVRKSDYQKRVKGGDSHYSSGDLDGARKPFDHKIHSTGADGRGEKHWDDRGLSVWKTHEKKAKEVVDHIKKKSKEVSNSNSGWKYNSSGD